MDFLTQPFNSPSPPPPSPLVSTSNRVSDGSSILTTSTTDTTQARQESNAAFQHLRATPQASLGIPDETPISLPSVKNGDWRAYGRVQANVVLWQDGVLGTKKKLSTDQIEEEWSVTGSLWFTKNRETILLLDRSVPPQEIARNQPKPAPATSRRLSFGRLRSVSPTSTRDVDTQQANVSTSTNANEDPSTTHQESGGGFFQKVLDAVRPGRKERRSSGGSDGLSLSRSRSRSRPTEVTHSHGGGPGSIDSPKKTLDTITQDTAHLTFEEPASSRNLSPFPQYKGHSVTALYIASTDHIQSVRFYPQRPISSGPDLGSFFSFAKEAEPLSSPPNSPSLATSSAGGTQFEAPVVELDVIDPAHIGSGGDEGKKRQTTIGLRFVELLCATEAEDFHRLIEAAMSATGDESIPIHRTVSRSLDTNQTQRRKSWGIA